MYNAKNLIPLNWNECTGDGSVTKFKGHSSLEADRHSATQEISRLLWNPKN
jgi:hypothetical protein